MSIHGILIKTGGVAAAAAAHAVFAFGLMAGQPQPELYTARMTAHAQPTLAAAPTRPHLAQVCLKPQRKIAASPMPAVDSFRPEQMHKGQTTC